MSVKRTPGVDEPPSPGRGFRDLSAGRGGPAEPLDESLKVGSAGQAREAWVLLDPAGTPTEPGGIVAGRDCLAESSDGLVSLASQSLNSRLTVQQRGWLGWISFAARRLSAARA